MENAAIARRHVYRLTSAGTICQIEKQHRIGNREADEAQPAPQQQPLPDARVGAQEQEGTQPDR